MSDTSSFIRQGQELGYTGADLQAYVQQCEERYERAQEREARKLAAEQDALTRKLAAEHEARKLAADQEARKLEQEARKLAADQEARKLEQEARKLAADQEARRLTVEQEARKLAADQEAAKLSLELELEKSKLDFELQSRRIEAELLKPSLNSNNNSRSEPQFKPKIPELPRFDDAKDSIDAFLFRFESHATACKWDKTQWSLYLATKLQGTALSLLHSLSTNGLVSYDELKVQLLLKFQCTEDGFRERFRAVKPEVNESFTSFLTRARHLLDRWIDLSECDKSFEGLEELVLKEQILQSCCKDLAVFLRERKFTSIKELCESAELYRTAHPGKNLARKLDPAVFSSVGVGHDYQHKNKFSNSRGSVNNPPVRGNRGAFSSQNNRGALNNPSVSTPESAVKTVSDSDTNTTNGTQNKQYNFQKRGTFRGNTFRRTQRGGSTRTQNNSIVCHKCGGIGHISWQCPSGPLSANVCDVEEEDEEEQAANVCHILISALANQEIGSLPVVTGTVNGMQASILRDTGCTTAGVKRSLVTERQFTGKTQRCITFGGKVETFPLASVLVDTPFYKGEVLCCVIEHPVADLILGNLPGVSDIRSDQSTTNKPATTKQATPKQVKPKQASLVTTRLQEKNKNKPPAPLKVPSVAEFQITLNELIQQQHNDATLNSLFLKAQTGKTEKSGKATVKFIIKDGLLLRQFQQNKKDIVEQIVVPVGLRDTVLTTAHDSIMAGHCGTRRTLQRVLNRFYWTGVRCSVKRYCNTCDICQKTVNKGRVQPVPLESMPLIDTPFKRIAIDLIGPFQPVSNNGHRYVLTIIDVATRFPYAIPLKNIDTISVAEALLSVFTCMGCPQEILSDCGTQFLSDLMKEFYRLMSIMPIHTSPYHPQSNGMVERFNGTLKTMLKKVVKDQPTCWDRYIPALLFAYRELPNESTGFSPFELLFGRRPHGPIDILANSWCDKTADNEGKLLYQYIFDLKNMLADMANIAKENVQIARTKNKHHFDKKTTSRKFNVGDEVLVLLPTDSNKLLMSWKGPFIVTATFNSDYRIQMGNTEKVFHANMLKKYERRTTVQPEQHAVNQNANSSVTQPESNVTPTLISPLPDNTLPDDGTKHHTDFTCVYSMDLASASVAVLPHENDDHQVELPTIPSQTGENVSHIQYGPQLDPQKRKELESVFNDFKHILTDKPGQIKLDIEHEIKQTTDATVRTKPYPLPFSARKTVEKEVKSMIDLGVIEPSQSSYSSPVVLVTKKDGSTRFCIDFRSLNKITEFDAEPIPDPEEIFCRLSGASYFTKIDLAKGYWQIPVSPKDKHKTAFQTPLGLYQWTKMPFGLVSAPATFARMMRLLNLDEASASNFYDDILIASASWEEHLIHVRKVLEKLDSAGLTARPSKVLAGFEELEFLGHVIGKGIIKPEISKIQKILAVTTPKTRRQVRSLLGLVSYYRRYIPNFATLTAPLSDLTKAGRGQIVWTEQCATALKEIQRILSSFPVLLLPDMSKKFIVRTDASSTGLGVTLLQEENDLLHPVMFASRKLLDRETRYSTIERECLAIVWGLTKFSRYLWGREFVLQTDHRPLLYLNSGKFKNSRIMRWALSLQEFKFSVEALPGNLNQFADFLSRSDTDQEIP